MTGHAPRISYPVKCLMLEVRRCITQHLVEISAAHSVRYELRKINRVYHVVLAGSPLPCRRVSLQRTSHNGTYLSVDNVPYKDKPYNVEVRE